MKKIILLLVLLITQLAAAPASAKTILYVPFDNRPVSLENVKDTARAAGVEIITPQHALLAGRASRGNPDYLWDWLVSCSQQADAIVVSADALLYGSLVGSRVHDYPEEVLAQRAARFARLKQINPSVRLYVFSTIMRTPQASAGGVEPDYYETYGPSIFQITALQDKSELQPLSRNEQQTLQTLLGQVPREHLDDWFARRLKNYKMNVKLIARTKDDTFDYLLLGRDDCSPFSQSHKESRLIAREARNLPASKYACFPGADQLGMLLVTRAINDFSFHVPIVKVHFTPGAGPKTIPSYEDTETGQTIMEQILTAGGLPLLEPASFDMVLAVNTPEDGLTLEAGNPANKGKASPATMTMVRKIRDDINAGKQVAVADIAFANGADNAFMHELAKRGLLPRLASYSGWNTASNTLGFAISQGMLAPKMTPQSKNRLLYVRYLDDWAYQANVRWEVAEKVLWPTGGNYFYLDESTPLITAETETRLQAFAAVHLKEFGQFKFKVSFPWNRMFEVDVAAE
jgi:hypothetical protein